MFTSGYAAPPGISGGSGSVSTHNSTNSMPVSVGSSSASATQHYSTLAGGSNSSSTGNSVVVSGGVGGGSVIVGRNNRVYDLEMINTQHSGGVSSSASGHSMLSAAPSGRGGGRGGGFDAYSHSSLYSTPQPSPSQRHLHQQQQHQQQQYYHYLHQQQKQHYYMPPMITNIKSEPMEQLTITPSIQMEEIIIKRKCIF